MKFSIKQQELIVTLTSVSRCCGVKSQLPVLANVLLQVSGGRLTLSATNLELGVVKSIPVEVTEDGEVTVPAKTLVEVISNLGLTVIEFEANVDQLKVSTSNFNSQINGISASEFPVIPLSGQKIAEIEPVVLTKTLPEIAFASAVDDGRPVLTGILTQIQDKKLQLVATDGYRLAHKTIPLDQDLEFKALVPKKTFDELLRLVSEEEIDKLAILTSDNQNQIIFSFGSTSLSSRLIEGQYPAWEKIIPTEIKTRIITERGEVVKAVKLASVFAKNEANVVKVNSLPDSLVFTSETKELGSQETKIAATTEGEGMIIGFNTKFLYDALCSFNASQMIMELSGPLLAASIKPVGESGLQYIIMPVNLG